MIRVIAENGVLYYHSQLIPCIHGFSTRIGGVSTLPHTKSLNLGVDRGDDRDTVLKNLELFADALGVSDKEFISVPQIHSADIRHVTSKNAGEGFFRDAESPCDGYIATEEGIVLGVRTADCVPILIYAPPNNNFGGAVMALHAGWRGTAAGIVTEAIERAVMLGAERDRMRAAIGPSICSDCYSVRSDFYESFRKMAGERLTETFVVRDASNKDRWYADLKGANRSLLTLGGLAPENVDVCRECTSCKPDEFYSHRYSGGVRGTMLSAITLKHKDG